MTWRRRPTADHAIAVSYRARDKAPCVAAQGRAEVALAMKQTARRFGIPVHHDEKLARALSTVAPESEIPEELFESVARVFIATRTSRR